MKTREKILFIPFCPIPSMITLWPMAANAQNYLPNSISINGFVNTHMDKQFLNKQNTSIYNPNNTIVMKKITITLMLILGVVLTFAQAPQAFKYQAVVRDNAGEIYSSRK